MSNEMAVNPVIITSTEQANQAFSMANLIFHPTAMDRISHYSERMAQSKSLLPQVFHNNPSACEALLIKAGSLNMDPYAIGAHAFQQPNGVIGFEAKVYQAIAQVAGGVDFEFEFFGPWENIKTGMNRKQALNDEAGCGVKVIGTYPNGKTKEWSVEMKDCFPRFSTNWTNNPKSQTRYRALKEFLRAHSPALIMGIFDREDLEAKESTEKELNPKKKPGEKTETESVLSKSIQSKSEVKQEVKEEVKPEQEIEEAEYEEAPQNEEIEEEQGPTEFEKFEIQVEEVCDKDSCKSVLIRWKERKSFMSDEEIKSVGRKVQALGKEYGFIK